MHRCHSSFARPRTWTRRLAAAALLTAGLAYPAHADTFAAHQRRGADYLQRQQYSLALQELKAAYEQVQRPLLLYYMARCYHQLGQRREAIEHYDRYIVSEPDPAQRAAAERYLVELGGDRVEDPLALPSPVASERTERSGPRWGMVAAGATIFGLAYGSALIMGALGLAGSGAVASKGVDVGLVQAGFGTLMVPLAGPMLSGLIIRSPEWSVPWTVVNLPAQIVGIVLLGAGSQRPSAKRSLAFLPNLGPGSASFTVAGRF